MKYVPANKGKNIIKKDYSKEILFGIEEFSNDGHLLQTVTIPPNTKQREHFHNKQTEVFYILEGACKIYFNGMEFEAKPGDSFICEPEDRHYLWNQSNTPFKLIVFKINMPEEDTVWT